jgi:hypothetical protein
MTLTLISLLVPLLAPACAQPGSAAAPMPWVEAEPEAAVAAPLEAEGGGPMVVLKAEDGINGDDPKWNARLVAPVTQPYLFEEPMINTSVKPVFIRHNFPNSSVLGGGHLKAYALQIRYAVTERFGIIAVKDGRIDFQADAFPDSWGWADVAAGVKYAFHADPEAGTIVTGGIVFEASNGSRDVLQGNGDGGIRPFVTGGKDFGEINTVAQVGGYWPRDGDAESKYIDYHLHLSYEMTEDFWPLIELNGITYVSSGEALPLNEEGLDYANLGSTNVTGNDYFSGAVGFRYRINDLTDFGFAYEESIGGRDGIFDNRYTIDLIKRF